MSVPLTDRPEVPGVRLRSSALTRLPTWAWELMPTVHWLFVTRTGVTIRIQPLADTGRSVRCSAPPQFFTARHAAFGPPLERTQAVSSWFPSAGPDRYRQVSPAAPTAGCALTAVRRPWGRISSETVRVPPAQIGGEEPAVILPTELVKREST